MVPTLLAFIVAKMVLTGDVLGVAAGDLGQHDVGPFVVAPVVLADLALHVVIRQHGVVKRDTSLRRMALALGFVGLLTVTTASAILVVHAVNVDDALVALTWVALNLDHALIPPSLNRGLG